MINTQINVVEVKDGDILLVQHTPETDIKMVTLWHEQIAKTLEGTGIVIASVTAHAQLTILKNNRDSSYTRKYATNGETPMKQNEG